MNESLKKILLNKLDLSFLNKENIAIDCGHLPVLLSKDNKFVFGNQSNQPTETQLATFDLGIFLFKKLKVLKKNPKISLCFSDTTRFIKDHQLRKNLLISINNGEIINLLPKNYKVLINENSLKITDFIFSLQTKNSNRFLNHVTRAKKFIKKKSQDIQKIFERYGAIFLEDNDSATFGFINHFSMSSVEEEAALGGDWWKDDTYNITDNDLIEAPFVRVKKLGIIKLYRKGEGVLCPSTYAGLLLNFENTYDHISIYSRKDDEFVAEKIIRGVISALVFVDGFERNLIQIVMPAYIQDLEVSYLSPTILRNVTNEQNGQSLYISYQMSKLQKNYKLYI